MLSTPAPGLPVPEGLPPTGPIVSIVLPCFGQTAVKGGAGTRLIERKSARRHHAVTLD